MTERLIHLDLPTHESEASLRRFLGRLPKSGGSVLEVDPPFEVAPTAGEMAAEIELSPTRIMRPHFFAMAIEGQNLHKTHATYLWKLIAQAAPTQTEDNLAKNFVDIEVDLDLLRLRMRQSESGQDDFLTQFGIGEKYWNLLARIINHQLGKPDLPDLVLPWQPTLHAGLKSEDRSVRDTSIEGLREMYESAQQLVLFRG